MPKIDLAAYGWRVIGTQRDAHGSWDCWDHAELSDGRAYYTKSDATSRTREALRNHELEEAESREWAGLLTIKGGTF